ncbi:MAG: glutamate racemase [Patescibacteria group bacterium]
MRIGIFDSGVGGLIVARAIHKLMPQYDYVYLGDTKRVPYGNRSKEVVYEFTKAGVEYLFKKENCALVIVACNTASAMALRRLQKNLKNRKILGVLIPAAEEAGKYSRIGVLATVGTVASKSFPQEINKIDRHVKVFQNATPMLVPLAEAGEHKSAEPFIKEYLAPLLKQKINALVLGCTHYPFFKMEIKKALPKNVKIISQDEIVPRKLKNYLTRHPEIQNKLSKNRMVKILVTDKTKTTDTLTHKWFGRGVKPKLVTI